MASKDGEYIGVSELAAAVGETLAEIADTDKRMKSGATEVPTERTIRFYLEKGLLPKPSKRLGQTLVFGRVHLLTLLVIKKLQADGVPLSAIPDILKKKGKTEAHLEEFLSGDDENALRLEVFQSRTGRLDASDQITVFAQAASMMPPKFNEEAPESPPASASPASEAKSYLRSLLSRSAPRAAPKKTQTDEESVDVLYSVAPPTYSTPTSIWRRHALAPGAEINISHDYEPPKDDQGKEKLIEELREILGL